jgi:hypothetical protein
MELSGFIIAVLFTSLTHKRLLIKTNKTALSLQYLCYRNHYRFTEYITNKYPIERNVNENENKRKLMKNENKRILFNFALGTQCCDCY